MHTRSDKLFASDLSPKRHVIAQKFPSQQPITTSDFSWSGELSQNDTQFQKFPIPAANHNFRISIPLPLQILKRRRSRYYCWRLFVSIIKKGALNQRKLSCRAQANSHRRRSNFDQLVRLTPTCQRANWGSFCP